MKSVLSVDVAKGKSMIMLSTEYGEVLIEPKEIKHNFRDFNELKDKIESFNLEDLTIFMESTGIYHLPVERYFKDYWDKLGLSKEEFDIISKLILVNRNTETAFIDYLPLTSDWRSFSISPINGKLS